MKGVPQFFQKESRFLGVDIGASSIKAVELRKEKERPILETYGELSLAKYGEGDVGRALRLVDKKLTEALTDIINEAQIKSKKVAVSIPLKDSFLTIMELPDMATSDLKEAVPYEARKYIPIPIGEVVLDWWVLPPKSDELAKTSIGSKDRKFKSVILAAVPKDVIAKYKSIFESAGLEIVAFEIEAFAFAVGALKQELGTVLLMDFGASATKMVISDGGAVRAAHILDHGAQELTLSISQSLSIDFERAEILKRDSGALHRPETEGIASILEPMIEFVASEGERFLLNWKRKGGKEISKVLIGGGGAHLKGIEDLFIKKYGVEVMVVNPFSKVIYPAFLEPALKEVGATFVNAVGLALKEF